MRIGESKLIYISLNGYVFMLNREWVEIPYDSVNSDIVLAGTPGTYLPKQLRSSRNTTVASRSQSQIPP